MSLKNLFDDELYKIFFNEYQSFVSKLKYDNTFAGKKLSYLWDMLRSKYVQFSSFSNKQLDNKLIAYRNKEGVEIWPNVSKLDDYLSHNAKQLVKKARESALLALDIYNRPMSVFKTEGFIVMLTIAYTSLLHAIFERKGTDYYYHDDNGDFKYRDGEKKAWELSESINHFYGSDNCPEKKNLEFLIKLRNKIEHRYAPEIDVYIIGECQSALLNFDELIVNEFGDEYAIKECLSIPLMTSKVRNDQSVNAIKKIQSNQYDDIKEFVNSYRDSLSDEIYTDQKYSFKLFLMPKLGNHKNTSDLALEFIHFDSSSSTDMESYKNIIAIKEKQIPVANLDKMKPSTVVKIIKDSGISNFNLNTHANAWKYYEARTNDKTGKGCNTKFCLYDSVHKDYVYTKEWVKFLLEKFKDSKELDIVRNYKSKV